MKYGEVKAKLYCNKSIFSETEYINSYLTIDNTNNNIDISNVTVSLQEIL